VCFIHPLPVLQGCPWDRHLPAWLLEPGWSPALPGGGHWRRTDEMDIEAHAGATRESDMKARRKTDMAAVTKRRAPLCLCGARNSLHYLHDLMTNMERVRQTEDREGVHRMRVASRHLRSLLPLFAICLSRKTSERWRKQLRRLTRALGEVRDIDVKIA